MELRDDTGAFTISPASDSVDDDIDDDGIIAVFMYGHPL